MRFNVHTDAAQAKKLEKVRFEFCHETAHDVCIAGTFNEWTPERTPMRPAAPGQWTRDLLLAPGAYEYQFVVDGSWLNDPQAVKSNPSPCGGRNSVVIVESSLGRDLLGNSSTRNKK